MNVSEVPLFSINQVLRRNSTLMHRYLPDVQYGIKYVVLTYFTRSHAQPQVLLILVLTVIHHSITVSVSDASCVIERYYIPLVVWDLESS